MQNDLKTTTGRAAGQRRAHVGEMPALQSLCSKNSQINRRNTLMLRRMYVSSPYIEVTPTYKRYLLNKGIIFILVS